MGEDRLDHPGVETVAGVSIVVPAFNSAATLDALCSRIHSAMGSLAPPRSWEMILVNDGSADSSWERVEALSRAHPAVFGIDLTRNFGQHNALLAGIQAARHELIVTLDDDLQDRPEEIPRLLEAVDAGADLVYARPVVKRRSLMRRIGTKVVRAIVFAVSRGRIPLYTGGFRAFRSSLLDRLGDCEGARFAIDTPLGMAAQRVTAVDVTHARRTHGRSNYSFAKLIEHAVTELRSVLVPQRLRRRRRARTYAVRRTTGHPKPDRPAPDSGPALARSTTALGS